MVNFRIQTRGWRVWKGMLDGSQERPEPDGASQMTADSARRPAGRQSLPPAPDYRCLSWEKKEREKKERSGYQSISCQCAVTHAHRGSERLSLFWLAIDWRTQCWGAGTWQPCYPVIRSSRKVRRHAAVWLWMSGSRGLYRQEVTCVHVLVTAWHHDPNESTSCNCQNQCTSSDSPQVNISTMQVLQGRQVPYIDHWLRPYSTTNSKMSKFGTVELISQITFTVVQQHWAFTAVSMCSVTQKVTSREANWDAVSTSKEQIILPRWNCVRWALKQTKHPQPHAQVQWRLCRLFTFVQLSIFTKFPEQIV